MVAVLEDRLGPANWEAGAPGLAANFRVSR